MDSESKNIVNRQRNNRILLVVLVITVIIILLVSFGVISVNTSGFNSSKDNVEKLNNVSNREQDDLESYINEYMMKQDIALKQSIDKDNKHN